MHKRRYFVTIKYTRDWTIIYGKHNWLILKYKLQNKIY